jgi:hypothetical protein
MNCKLCGRDLDEQLEADEIDYDIAQAYENNLCSDCLLYKIPSDEFDIEETRINAAKNKWNDFSSMVSTIEYRLICIYSAILGRREKKTFFLANIS